MLNKSEKKSIALSRIHELFSHAESIFNKDKNLANRYVQLARKIGMRTKVSIPRNLKRKFCKNCYHFLFPGMNCRVRTRNSMAVYYCLDCKHYNRYKLK